jgi:hypothetical protein
LRKIILLSPAYGKFLKITLDPEGDPIQADVDQAAESRVMVRVAIS